ncbi:hypothetical protein DYB37_010528 [Aphanomyces astaci]|uniref:DDE-1 domain-containing protein n=1 Tax=Aphanomyces astaci TaxID=112090 RepID=A0A3R7C8X0_APHAT|nr:hypothetical protein DYB37_010528 [Aphanomyces astaci]
MQEASTRDVAADTGIPKSNLARWKKQSSDILHFEGTMKRFHLHGAGRPVMIPNADGLEAFMHKRRDAELALTCTHLVNYLKRNHKPWLEQYLSDRQSGYKSLLKLLQQFCAHHGFTRQKPAKSKQTQEQLEKVRQEFAQDFNVAFSGFSPSVIINVDETGMRYDMPPHAIWSVKGGSSKISSGEKHSYRMTAVLPVRANGEKLPILFILRGEPGGRIETGEFETYPIGHYYAVQESAWMDARPTQPVLPAIPHLPTQIPDGRVRLKRAALVVAANGRHPNDQFDSDSICESANSANSHNNLWVTAMESSRTDSATKPGPITHQDTASLWDDDDSNARGSGSSYNRGDSFMSGSNGGGGSFNYSSEHIGDVSPFAFGTPAPDSGKNSITL